MLTGVGKHKHTAAAVKKCVRSRELNHALYRKILQGPVMLTPSNQSLEDHFIHQNHTKYTVDQCKVGLTRYDDKPWILQNGVNTRPHCHYLKSCE